VTTQIALAKTVTAVAIALVKTVVSNSSLSPEATREGWLLKSSNQFFLNHEIN
jgi:hypothetical protein